MFGLDFPGERCDYAAGSWEGVWRGWCGATGDQAVAAPWQPAEATPPALVSALTRLPFFLICFLFFFSFRKDSEK